MTVRYADAAKGISNVRLVAVWNRGDLTEMDMSNSSGPKDQIRNGVFAIFEAHPLIQRVAILSTPKGHPFTVMMANNGVWFDRLGKPVIIRAEEEDKKNDEFIG